VTNTKTATKRLNISTIITIGVVVISVLLAGYFYVEAENAREQSPEAVAARNLADSQRIVEKVSEILITESEAEPTVARVEDPQVLRDANPDFYKNVDAGDYLVLYPQRAIIYRESENRVINVAPIINTSQIAPSADQADVIETGESE
jgi:hypothetical protein